jgi:hypothetical protein
VSGKQLFGLLARAYAEKPNDFKLSIGHFEQPYPGKVTMFNMPEFHAKCSITMADVRQWEKEEGGAQ